MEEMSELNDDEKEDSVNASDMKAETILTDNEKTENSETKLNDDEKEDSADAIDMKEEMIETENEMEENYEPKLIEGKSFSYQSIFNPSSSGPANTATLPLISCITRATS